MLLTLNCSLLVMVSIRGVAILYMFLKGGMVSSKMKNEVNIFLNALGLSIIISVFTLTNTICNIAYSYVPAFSIPEMSWFWAFS